jgi:hypothetical protein
MNDNSSWLDHPFLLLLGLAGLAFLIWFLFFRKGGGVLASALPAPPLVSPWVPLP